jgi:putative hydrolase of HD superfamily
VGTPAALARFAHRIGRLKRLPRTGWLDRDVPTAETESVADHSFRTALLAWLGALLAEPALNAERVLKLALIHDLAEALTGDDPPYAVGEIPDRDETDARRAFLEQRHVRDPARAAAKQAAEDAAMRELIADLPPTLTAELQDLWAEYQAHASPEARFVKQADRLETYLQAREYQTADPGRPIASFAAEVDELVTDSTLAPLRDAIATLTLEPPSR